MINKETVQSIAHLARLEFSDQELPAFAEQMNQILEFVEQLNELDTDSIEATSHAVEIPCPMRDDSVQESSVIDTILDKNAPDAEDGFFRVPKVL
jgi:aspartyl-tRNA(Asn)/glutamyl-tRNA(Gln) amidotransferase subunit C